MMPGMLCAVVAPFIGAALTEGLGWRSIMWFLGIAGATAQLAVLLVYRETQHHRVIRRLQQQLPRHQLPLPAWVQQECSANLQQTPNLSPKQLLPLLQQLLVDPKVLPFLLLLMNAFGCMFLVLLQLSGVLAATTSLSSTNIGLCYLATGVCSAAGSLLGGWVADKADAATGATKTARLEWAALSSMLLIPAGLLLVGWTEPAGWRGAAAIAITIIGGSLACFGSSFTCPGVYSHLSHRAGQFAAAVLSLAASGTNFWPAALLQLNPLARESIGLGVYNTAVSGFTLGLSAVCCGVCMWQRRCRERGGSISSVAELGAQQDDAEVAMK